MTGRKPPPLLLLLLIFSSSSCLLHMSQIFTFHSRSSSRNALAPASLDRSETSPTSPHLSQLPLPLPFSPFHSSRQDNKPKPIIRFIHVIESYCHLQSSNLRFHFPASSWPSNALPVPRLNDVSSQQT